MPLHDLLQGDRPLFTAADAFQGAFSQIQILDLFQVLEDGFTDIVGLGAPGPPGKLLQAFFDGLRKSNGQHNYLAIQVYHDADRGPQTTLRTLIDETRLVIVVEGTEALSCTPRASARRSMAITFRKMRFT
jgi:hypothetical protein